MTFLKFSEIHDTGKTKIWKIENSNDGSYLGEIKWHGAWRKYVLSVNNLNVPAIWSAGCLNDVAEFINYQMELRKTKGL